jgi:hypothetical protein
MTTMKTTDDEKVIDIESIPPGFCAQCGLSHRELTSTGVIPDHGFKMHGENVTKPAEETYLSTMRQDPNAKCATCSNTWMWHQTNGDEIRHAFNDGTMAASETFGKKLASGDRTSPTKQGQPAVVEEVRWPFDPVLRQALIDKGVITPDDLTRAEATIRAVTDNFNGGKS